MFTTRIAPSPTGHLHIGNLRTAYFNWLAARSTGGKFILRIDNTDKKRSKRKYIRSIKRTLKYFGMDWDICIKQSKRFKIHRKLAKDLVKLKLATKNHDGSIILNIQHNAYPKDWFDQILGDVRVTKQDLQDISNGIVLIKSDKNPTYIFSSIVDDVMLSVDYIIRGVDHIKNTPKQLYILQVLINNNLIVLNKSIKFAHVGLITNGNKPMSKRDGVDLLQKYIKDNKSSDAMLNFILRMGWGPKIDNKQNSIIPKDRAIKMFFNDGKMRSAPSKFDQDKLNWYNRKYKKTNKGMFFLKFKK